MSATDGDVDLAAAAALLADPTRAQMIVSLADGRALPAGELARRSGVNASTGTHHLQKLQAAGWIDVERCGRHRYYRLAGSEVIALAEDLARAAPRQKVTSLRSARVAEDLRRARTCYDHLAGRLGVTLTAALVERGALRPDADAGYAVDRDRLAGALAEVGITGDLLATAGRRRLARPCLDWSERRHHLAGALGAALAGALVEHGWVARRTDSRAVTLTRPGVRHLAPLLGPDAADLAGPA